MNFTKLKGLKVTCYLVLFIVFMTLTVFLLYSTKESLRRTDGKWRSIVDEIFIGFIVLIAFAIIAQVGPSSIISFLTKPLRRMWDLVLKTLWFVDIKIQRAIMRSVYNYTAVGTYKQKLYIPYIGIELNGWGMALVTPDDLLFALIPIDIPAYHLFGSLGILLPVTIVAILEIGATMFLIEVDRGSRESKLIAFYYWDVENYRILYDFQRHAHRLLKEREGRVHRCIC